MFIGHELYSVVTVNDELMVCMQPFKEYIDKRPLCYN